MAKITVSMCDLCGKRQDKFAGRLVLYGDFIQKDKTYTSQKTLRSWRLCQSCLNYMVAQKSQGDQIKDEIELKLDSLRVERYKPNLLK
ncbi:unnamed protein product [marine sediment metagenome]|uniref:YlxR domain-containing protein n=1 Tax=marine sediment metagenome TaxID=412755 RepID=X0ZDM5_9ZZZZ